MSHHSVMRWFEDPCVECMTACSQLASDQTSSSANAVSASELGVSFVEGSVSQVIVEHQGRKYVVDVASHQIRLVAAASQVAPAESKQSPAESKQSPAEAAHPRSTTSESAKSKFYKPGDDFLFNVPPGRPVERHSLVINFAHRFPYEAVFTGPGRGDTLSGLDDFSVSSLGLRSEERRVGKEC